STNQVDTSSKPSSGSMFDDGDGDITMGTIVGTCTDMCPVSECIERERDRDLSVFEIVPGTGSSKVGDVPVCDRSKAVKKYKRAAAAKSVDPSQVRAEEAIIKTINYLFTQVFPLPKYPLY